ncbi:regulator of G protein signaling superfamily [Obba rivulosa]|uniref:Regulator of G protein signaling superfamily n=1 Tax=Obba rivulosa TaxID=1052685 RepID=A0A8E2DKQ9_9APHY|nr:regulator of G protein signaling superfamily [Obba rivulosa]
MASETIEIERIGVTSAKSQIDLLRFASLMCALKWSSKRPLLGTVSYSYFYGGDAVEYLTSSSLSDIDGVSNTTITPMPMTNEEAEEWCRGLISAHLIEKNFSSPRTSFTKSRNYTLTPKGLHVLEQLVNIDNIADNGLRPLFSSQPIPQKMLHLQRRPEDGSIIFSEPMITTLFRCLAGPQPNFIGQELHSKRGVWLEGIPLSTIRQSSSDGLYESTSKDCFYSQTVLDWLCDSTTVSGTEEAAKVAAHFARRGLIARVPRPNRKPDANPKWERVGNIRESNTDSECLTCILRDSNLLSLFLKFTRSQNFEDNVSFYLDVQKLKPVHMSASEENSALPPKDAIYHIYEEYLAPFGPKQLNLDGDLRRELSAYLSHIIPITITKSHDDGVRQRAAVALDGMQSSLMIRLYDRIQKVIFRILAKELVPKFIDTPYFFAVSNERCGTLDISLSDANNLVQFASQEHEDRDRVYISISKKAFYRSR